MGVYNQLKPDAIWDGNSTSGNSFRSISSGSRFAYGRAASGHFVALLRFNIPSSVKANIYKIVLNMNSYSTVGNGYKTQAKLAKAIPSSDTPNGWRNHTALSTSTEYTGANHNVDTLVQYTFTSGLSSISGGDTVRIWLYGTTASSYSEAWRNGTYPNIDIYYTDASSSAIAPNSVTRSTLYKGFSSSSLSFTVKSSSAGYFYVTTDSPSSSSAKWWRKTTSSASSATISVDKDTSTTSLTKAYYVTCLPTNSGSSYTGALSAYLGFNAPRFALKFYGNSSNAVEINSSDFSSLPSSYNNPDGYSLSGYASSSGSTSITNNGGTAWSSSLNDVTRYGVYYNAGFTAAVTLNANGGSVSASTASKSVAPAWIYGTGQSSGGAVTYSGESVVPSRFGYGFMGWRTSTSVIYNAPKYALDAGYTGALTAVWVQNRGLRIFDSSLTSDLYAAYIYSNGSYGYYVPYIYNGSSWQEMG